MKKILFSLVIATALVGFAKDAYDIKPAADSGTVPTAVEWQNANDAALAAATEADVLAAFVADEAAARTLLAQLRGAYETDPLVACQVAAVTQWVMGPEPCFLCFWADSPAKGRKVWVKALLETAETNSDTYIKTFCLDQLRWCACPCPCAIKRIRAIGAGANDRRVRDFSEVVVRELEGKSIGL